MVRTCAVLYCGNNQKANSDLAFYSFPKDESRFIKWQNAAGLIALSLDKTYMICGAHFERNAFRLQDILLKIPTAKRRLNETAVPTINLPLTDENEDRKQEIHETIERRKLVEDLLLQHAAEEQKQREDNLRDQMTQTISDNSSLGEAKRTITVLTRQLDAVAWKVGQQQAEMFQVKKELNRFRQFFSVEEADLIAQGLMIPKTTEGEEELQQQPAGPVKKKTERIPEEMVFVSENVEREEFLTEDGDEEYIEMEESMSADES